MICLNCRFWEKDLDVDFNVGLYISEAPYLLKSRGHCDREGIVTCFDEGCEWFKSKLEEDDK